MTASISSCSLAGLWPEGGGVGDGDGVGEGDGKGLGEGEGLGEVAIVAALLEVFDPSPPHAERINAKDRLSALDIAGGLRPFSIPVTSPQYV
ncbi:MAG: hypothetical protein AAF553_01190 [Pseudomonadota bacterium]